jgi:hypothetical protein
MDQTFTDATSARTRFSLSLPAEADGVKAKMLVLALQFSRCAMTHAELDIPFLGRPARRSGVVKSLFPTPSKRKRRR